MIFFAIDVHFWLTAASIDTETICRPEKKEQNLMYFSLFIFTINVLIKKNIDWIFIVAGKQFGVAATGETVQRCEKLFTI